jgi:hypothetical protein
MAGLTPYFRIEKNGNITMDKSFVTDDVGVTAVMEQTINVLTDKGTVRYSSETGNNLIAIYKQGYNTREGLNYSMKSLAPTVSVIVKDIISKKLEKF